MAKTLPSGVCLHDMIVDELFEEKSFAALIYLIDCGRELEISFNGEEYFISRDAASKCVSIWNKKDKQSFDSVYELIEKAKLQGKDFISVWDEIKLDYLF